MQSVTKNITFISTFLIQLFSLSSTFGSSSKRAETQRQCYGDLGCFSTNSILTKLPLSPDELQTEYHVYSRTHRNSPTVLQATHEDQWPSLLQRAGFSGHRNTKFIIHGYQNNGTSPWIIVMKNELLIKGDFNVVVVSWGAGTHLVPVKTVATVFLLAAQVSRLIRALQSAPTHLRLTDLHLIGHSFGAQASGNIGVQFQGQIARISGLDPAEPFFTDMDTSKRLDKSDAAFVDVIHSDAEPYNGLQGYGLMDASGDLDFYPNGGIDQPGCTDDLFSGLLGAISHDPDLNIACSHSRSHDFFIASINAHGCQFRGYPCANWDAYKAGNCGKCPSGGCPLMGYAASASHARGSFFLATTMSYPYCGYEYLIEMDLTDHHPDEDSFGRFFITLLGDHSSSEAEFSRNDVHYHQRNTETQVVAVNHRVGSVAGVKVRFQHKTGFSASATDKTVFIHKVIVKDTATGQRTTFCTGDVELSSNAPMTFTSHTGC